MGMRQRIADKLQDSGGATILMALFAMLVASVVCIVILGASVTAVKQSVADHEQEQNTLALQSAGELVRSEILNTGTIVFQAAQDADSFTGTTGSPTAVTSLSSELIDVAQQTLQGVSPVEESFPTGTGGFTIDAVTTASDELEEPYEQPQVKGDIVLKSSGQLIVTLSVDGTTGSAGPQYLFLTVGCDRTVDPASSGSGPKATFVFHDATFSLVREASANG